MSPECVLAKELGIPYATAALATDYDCWKDEENVSMELVMQTFKENAIKAKALFVAAVSKIAAVDWAPELTDLKVFPCIFYIENRTISDQGPPLRHGRTRGCRPGLVITQ